MAVSVVPNLELLGRAPPEKTVNPETPNTQNSFEFPHLKEAENHPKKGQSQKRKKSNETSPPGNPKKKGTRLPKSTEAAASILDEAQTQPDQREEAHEHAFFHGWWAWIFSLQPRATNDEPG